MSMGGFGKKNTLTKRPETEKEGLYLQPRNTRQYHLAQPATLKGQKSFVLVRLPKYSRSDFKSVLLINEKQHTNLESRIEPEPCEVK